MKYVSLAAVLAAVLVAASGCDTGPKYVPVSGIVTLDGQPYTEAVVVFQPQATESNPNPGRGSSSYTDAKGRFTLKTDEGQEGAVRGKHLVRIMTKGNNVVIADPSLGSPDSGSKARFDPIPAEWNALSDKTFEVPAAGTDQANFDIKRKR
jgi:hypothetical protein